MCSLEHWSVHTWTGVVVVLFLLCITATSLADRWRVVRERQAELQAQALADFQAWRRERSGQEAAE
jgi:hypothetical protein